MDKHAVSLVPVAIAVSMPKGTAIFSNEPQICHNCLDVMMKPSQENC